MSGGHSGVGLGLWRLTLRYWNHCYGSEVWERPQPRGLSPILPVTEGRGLWWSFRTVFTVAVRKLGGQRSTGVNYHKSFLTLTLTIAFLSYQTSLFVTDQVLLRLR